MVECTNTGIPGRMKKRKRTEETKGRTTPRHVAGPLAAAPPSFRSENHAPPPPGAFCLKAANACISWLHIVRGCACKIILLVKVILNV